MPLCASVYMYLVVTCLERADLFAPFVVSNCELYFPIGILGLVWYLIVSIPDLCTLIYLDHMTFQCFALINASSKKSWIQ